MTTACDCAQRVRHIKDPLEEWECAIHGFMGPRAYVHDSIEAKESLTNEKPWFNGMKTFSSVKVNPAPLEDTPSVLGINVIDSIASGDRVG